MAKIGQPHAVRVIGTAEAAETDDVIRSPLDDEAVQVQVLVGLAQHHLQGGLQVGDRGIATDEDAAPDQGTDAVLDDAASADSGVDSAGESPIPPWCRRSVQPRRALPPTALPALLPAPVGQCALDLADDVRCEDQGFSLMSAQRTHGKQGAHRIAGRGGHAVPPCATSHCGARPDTP